MVNTVQHKRGTTAQVNSYTGAVGEFIYNTTTKRIHAQDGATAGGIPQALVSDVDLKANASITISAGSGLTGGGTLAANRTMALSSASIASLALADSAVQSVNGKTGSSITLTKADVGLGNVDNTSDASKPVSTATQTALNAKANSSVTVSAGTGLTGGGNLTANRSIALNSASIASLGKADTAIQAPGGTTGQVLAKSSNTDNDVSWVSSEAATAVSYGPQTLTDAQKTQARSNIGAETSYDTKAAAGAANIPSSINVIRLNGYHTAGDGGEALYKRVLSEPSHPGKVKSADGAWWLLCSQRINVRMFGAKGDASANDTQAFKDAYLFFKTGTEIQGGTIHVPRGQYRLYDELLFEGVDHATNFWLEGDGAINTRLDFSSAPAGKNGIVLRGGTGIGIKKLFITGAKEHGIVLNDNYDHFVSHVTLSELRIQDCGGNGIYSKNSYLVSLSDIWSKDNGADGVGFYGNHTSIIGRRVYASGNAGVGHRINGAVYIEYNAQSDSNGFYGYWLSNIRSAVFNALGSEDNGRVGIYIQTGLHTDNLFPEYQGFQGVIFNAAFNFRNATDGSSPNSFNVETTNGIHARFTAIGCEEDVLVGRPSIILDGNGGSIEVSAIDLVTKANIVTEGTVKIKSFDSLFP